MITILLPAYNEALSLPTILAKIARLFEQQKLAYRIIVCNDGSRDQTGAMLAEYARTMPIEVLTHKINRGLGETSRDLFERAAEICSPDDVIIRMDCDDTHEPEFIPRLISKLDEGYDVVIASRYEPGGGQIGVSAYRMFISRGANLFMKLFFPISGLKEYSCGFRAYRAGKIQEAIATFGNNFIQLKGLGFTCTLEKILKLKLIGARFVEVPFVLRYDQKQSDSKMVSSVTTLGYIVMVLLYHWPWGGWKSWKLDQREQNAPAKPTVEDVRRFWEQNPLWTGESRHPVGSKAFFAEHHDTILSNCWAGSFDPRFIPPAVNRLKVLDLGCGPGFWPVELAKYGCQEIAAADWTDNALQVTRQRCEVYGVPVELSLQNAEEMTFSDQSFSYVNCQGVMHHALDTGKCIQEIARVLKPAGMATISVCHRNIFLRNGFLLQWVGLLIDGLGGGWQGRGRERLRVVDQVKEIMRLYDEWHHPIGKAYTRQQFVDLLAPHFEVLDIYCHCFPVRALPFPIPGFLHRFLDRQAGFMMFATVRKL